ncbi:hypothetical protein D3C83_210380 [compost metagenome]
MYMRNEKSFLPGKRKRERPSPRRVPRMVEIRVEATPRISVFFAASSLSAFWRIAGYHWVVKPRHGPP